MKILRLTLALLALGFLHVAPAHAEDITYNVYNGADKPANKVLHDKGDGTYAPEVYVVGGAATALPTGAATAAKQPALGTAGTPSADVISVQGVSNGQPLPIAGQTANTVASAANPFPVALYIPGGTTGLSVSGTSTDTTSTSGTSSRLEVNAVQRIVNASGSLARVYQIDAATASGTGVVAMATAGASFSNITSATTTAVKGSAGIVQSIVVNTPAAGTITGYCNTSATGTKFATITTIASTQPFTITYNTYCTTGITIVTSAVMDITVNYR